MTASHGRAGRRGLTWFTTALAASGLFLAVSSTRPARACHISHNKPKAEATTATTKPSVTTTSATSSTPSQGFDQALQAFLKDWHDKTTPTPRAITPTSMTTKPAMTIPQAQVLIPTPAVSPTVQNWHQATSNACTPPPPPCTCATSPTTAPQGVIPPTPLKPPAALLNPAATPAPEPSTILTAAALVGAFAWRRRATRPRA